jgi:hypothetical protein
MFWACYGYYGYVLQIYPEFMASNNSYIIQIFIIQNIYYFIFFPKKKIENVEEDVPLMSMLHNKIKLEIDINTDELL